MHGGDILGTGVNGFAPFNQNRIRACLGQRQCRKETGRACAHHHRRKAELGLGQHRQLGRIHPIGHTRLESLEHRILILDLHVHGDDKVYVAFVTGIDGFLGQGDALQHICRDAQLAQNGLSQEGHVPAEGQG